MPSHSKYGDWDRSEFDTVYKEKTKKLCMVCKVGKQTQGNSWGMCPKCNKEYLKRMRKTKHINCFDCHNATPNRCLKIKTLSSKLPECLTKYERTGEHVLVLECKNFVSDYDYGKQREQVTKLKRELKEQRNKYFEEMRIHEEGRKEHLRELHKNGMTLVDIGELVGYADGTLRHVLYN